MKTAAQLILSYRRVFLVGMVAITIALLSGPDRAKAQFSEAPSVPHTVTIVSTTGTAGTQVFIDVELESAGNEVAGGFTVRFDQTKLSISGISSGQGTNPDVTPGTGLPAGSGFTINATQVANGRIGVLFDSSNTFAASPPNRQCVRFRFTISPSAAAGPTLLELVGNPPGPVGRSFSNALAEDIPMTWVNGTLTITAAAPPVTVSGRVTVPGGFGLRNAIVSLVDSNNIRRVATTSSFGYYTFTNVPSGLSYTASVSSRRYTFTPVTQTISTDINNLDFVGTGQ